MTFLPVVERELRAAARQKTVYWVRFGGAAYGLVLCAWIMLIPHFRNPQRLGTALFHTVAVATFVYSVIAGLHRTSDCLSEEKREGTLGLLFLTDLKGYDIILGKLVATSINGFYAMLGIFPVMAISLLAGGVGVGEFWRVVLVAVNNLFFSLALGMFCSAVSRDERRSIALAMGTMIFVAGGLPFMGALIADAYNRPANIAYFLPSPGYAAYMSFEENYKALGPGINYFYISVTCTSIMAAALLVLSCYIIPRTWQDRVERRETRGFRAWLLNLNYGAGATRARVRKTMLDINPVYWLIGRDRMKLVSVWAALVVTAGVWFWGLLEVGHGWNDQSNYVMTALWLHTILKIWIATEACRRFTADRRAGALELLLSTPITVREILSGQLLALLRQFGLAVLAVVLLDLAFLYAYRQDSDWVLIWVAGIIIFVADVIALSWVAMWMGLKSANANRASGAAMARLLVLPWLLFAMFATSVAIFEQIKPGPLPRWLNNEETWVILWMIVSLVVDLAFGLLAHRNLMRRFRETVAARFDQPRKGWLRRVFSSGTPVQPSTHAAADA